MKHISTGKLTRLPGKLARLPKKLRKDFQKGSWHFHQWQPSGWSRLCLRAISENLPPQVAIDSLWLAAGEGRIKATAIEYENAKAFQGNHDRNPRPSLAAFETHRRSVDRKGDVVRRQWTGSTERFSFPDWTSKNFGQSHAVVRRTARARRKPAPEQTRSAEPKLLKPKVWLAKIRKRPSTTAE